MRTTTKQGTVIEGTPQEMKEFYDIVACNYGKKTEVIDLEIEEIGTPKIAKYPKHRKLKSCHKRWSAKEDKILIKMKAEGKKSTQIARKLKKECNTKRSQGAINSRIWEKKC